MTPHHTRQETLPATPAIAARIRATCLALTLFLTPAWVLTPALLALTAFPAPALAQQKKTAPPALVKQVEGLLRGSLEDRLEILASLRQTPDPTREAMVYLLDKVSSPKDRARLAFHFIEFGTQDDLLQLTRLHGESTDTAERQALEGVMEALYSPSGNSKELQGLALELTFIQSGPAQAISDGRIGKWVYSPWSFQLLHRQSLPLNLIEQVRAVATRAYDTREEMEETLQKRLKKGVWEEYKDLLGEAADQVSATMEVEGRVRARLSNPLQTPILVRVNTGVWFGRFKNEPDERWVYLVPGEAQRVEFSLTAIGVRPERGLRLHLLLREVKGPILTSPQALAVPLQS